eukprot:CAMPEP_0184698532 /NCGR_PEP_ID=MMETSP0313-20130426/5132_1 /TAXON_ID=2792 /ORGANISM="Porphyridium aerugineum, Strain SAG 1380-2" /LENGTH=323 /DNA_ID=CAMNT_0027157495 /DNA_START=122 /DNA_END=1093 /DNA_ORIENTATION=-
MDAENPSGNDTKPASQHVTILPSNQSSSPQLVPHDKDSNLTQSSTRTRTTTNNSSGSGSGSLFDTVDDELYTDRLRLVKGTNNVVDRHGNVVGAIEPSHFFEWKFWENVGSALQSLQGSALFEYAQPRELHTSISSIGEVFVLAGSLVAGFALGFLQVADLGRVKMNWAIPTSLFITLAFLTSIASVCIATVLFVGVSTTPVPHVHLFAAHMGAWILRPGQLVYLSFVFLCAEFATVALTGPYSAVGKSCVILVGVCSFIMFVVALLLMERIAVVRNFVKEDVRRARDEERRQRKLMKKLKKEEKMQKFKHKKKVEELEAELA